MKNLQGQETNIDYCSGENLQWGKNYIIKHAFTLANSLMMQRVIFNT